MTEFAREARAETAFSQQRNTKLRSFASFMRKRFRTNLFNPDYSRTPAYYSRFDTGFGYSPSNITKRAVLGPYFLLMSSIA